MTLERGSLGPLCRFIWGGGTFGPFQSRSLITRRCACGSGQCTLLVDFHSMTCLLLMNLLFLEQVHFIFCLEFFLSFFFLLMVDNLEVLSESRKRDCFLSGWIPQRISFDLLGPVEIKANDFSY